MGQRSVNEAHCKGIIRTYIKRHKKEKTKVRSLLQIYHDIKTMEKNGEIKDFNISDKTFYRYANDMNLSKIGDDSFDFVVDHPEPFNKFLFRKRFNQFLCYKLKDISYGSLIVATLNDDCYKDYRNSFHCVLVGDMIICFYYNKEADTITTDHEKKRKIPYSFTQEDIIKDIRCCLKKFCITVTE